MATPKSKTKKTARTSASRPAKKSAPKAAPAKTSPEEKLAASTIKLLDQAAEVLKKTLNTSASTSAKTREAAKKKAHSLLGKAHTALDKSLKEGFSAAEKVLKRLP